MAGPPDNQGEFRAERRHDKLHDLLWPLAVGAVFPVKTVKPVNISLQRIKASFLRPGDTMRNLPVDRPKSPRCLLPVVRALSLGGRLSGILLFL